MLPPVEESVLAANPQFASLYKTLTTAILNPDGSTKDDPAAKERNATREELKAHRLKAARERLLIQAIASATPAEPKAAPVRRARAASQPNSVADLPPELLDLLLLLPPFLNAATIPPESLSLLLSNPPFSSFDTHLPQLGSLVSTSLHASAMPLARIASPTTNASYLHRSIPSIPAHIASLQSAIADEKTAAARDRLAAATSLVALLQTHGQALTLLIRSLEAKHGGVARSLELQAAEVAVASQKGAIDAEAALAAVRREVYTPEVRAALRNYAGHLRDAKVRAAEEIRTLTAQLEEYGVTVGDDGEEKVESSKGRTMKEMARVYRDMGRQIEEVKSDLERLGRA